MISRSGAALPVPADPHLLFRSPTLAARAGLGRGSRLCFVVFDPMVDDLSLDRPAFAEAFLRGHGYDAVHILSARNNWFQDAGLPDLLAKVRDAVAAYDRVVTYGSSMGGYAALRFAGRLGADMAIAISPQYSARADLAFENRWRGLRKNLDWLHEAPGEVLAPVAEALVIFDGRDVDRHHARLIQRDLPHAQMLALPHAGHPAGAVLAELGLLSSTILAAAHGRLDAAAVRLAARRRRTGHYLFTLARRQPPWRLRTKRRLALRAVEAAPGHSLYGSYAGVVLECCGETAAALEQHARATAAHDYELGELRHARALWRAGRTGEAMAVIERAKTLFRGGNTVLDMTVLDNAIMMRLLDGAPDEALAMLADHPKRVPWPAAAARLRRLARWPGLRTPLAARLGRVLVLRLTGPTVLDAANIHLELADADRT